MGRRELLRLLSDSGRAGNSTGPWKSGQGEDRVAVEVLLVWEESWWRESCGGAEKELEGYWSDRGDDRFELGIFGDRACWWACRCPNCGDVRADQGWSDRVDARVDVDAV